MNNENNITFLLEEPDQCEEKEQEFGQNSDNDLLNFYQINELLEKCGYTEDDFTAPQMVDYHLNYTVKGLLTIGEYYGIAKNIKACKLNKDQIIEAIVIFENDKLNYELVQKRKRLWFFMDELKKDKFMRKFLLCWN